MAAIFATLALLPICLALPQAAPATVASCSPLELIIARGSTEPVNPDYGVIVGDPIFEATKAIMPSITGYKVDYPASFEKDSKTKGWQDVLKHLKQQSASCPDQKYVLIGYSQGGDVMHDAASRLDKEMYDKIVALVMYGDPGNKGPNIKSPLGGTVPPFPEPLAQRLRQNCAQGDPVCTNSGKLPDEHLVYGDDKYPYMKDSALYIQKQFETKGKAGPQPSPYGGPQDKGNNTQALLELGKMLGAEPGQLEVMASRPA